MKSANEANQESFNIEKKKVRKSFRAFIDILAIKRRELSDIEDLIVTRMTQLSFCRPRKLKMLASSLKDIELQKSNAQKELEDLKSQIEKRKVGLGGIQKSRRTNT